MKEKFLLEPCVWARRVTMGACHPSRSFCRATEAPSVKLTLGTWVSSLLRGKIAPCWFLASYHLLQVWSSQTMWDQHLTCFSTANVNNCFKWICFLLVRPSGMPCKMRTFVSWPHLKQSRVLFSPSQLFPPSSELFWVLLNPYGIYKWWCQLQGNSVSNLPLTLL